ncbi:hypothetical protein GIB67_001232 [Kingdonia uniflora]|uniref:Uncharacterized protein n=1 Tax=Kingdonia uniflora TaxID=39325 RepID=A0A7J7LGL6_9MAGN|nr:hypothetical protein GIB67_001232 [Kingdonia uniflora]
MNLVGNTKRKDQNSSRFCLVRISYKADNLATQRARAFHLEWFLDPITNEKYPKTMQNIARRKLPRFTRNDKKMFKGSMDFLGVN